MTSDMMSEIFQLRKSYHYHLRHTTQFMAHPVHSVYNGLESAWYLRPKISESTPQKKRKLNHLTEFKE